MGSVFHRSRGTCQVPRAKAVMGIGARRRMRRRPGLCCFLPARTRVGGWSRIEVKFGLSAGWWALRWKGSFGRWRVTRGNWRRRRRIVGSMLAQWELCVLELGVEVGGGSGRCASMISYCGILLSHTVRSNANTLSVDPASPSDNVCNRRWRKVENTKTNWSLVSFF